MLRDRRAMVDTGLGPLAFVIVNAIAGLHTAAAVAVGLAVVLMVERLIRRRPVINAIGGLLGTGLAVFIALRTGNAGGLLRAAHALPAGAGRRASPARSLVRRPLVGFIVAALYRRRPRVAGRSRACAA